MSEEEPFSNLMCLHRTYSTSDSFTHGHNIALLQHCFHWKFLCYMPNMAHTNKQIMKDIKNSLGSTCDGNIFLSS